MKLSQKHPVVLSVAYAVLILLFAVAAGVVTTILKTDRIQTIQIQTVSFILSIIAGFFLMKKSGYSFSEYGFRSLPEESKGKILWLLPLVLVEASAFLVGLREGMTFAYVVSVLLFTLTVGINEEMYFRGLILKLLSIKGTKFAVIVSSVIFGIVHLGNIAGGADIFYTILQVLFAALFGLVCAEIAIKTKSLLIVIVWHFVHDFIAYSTAPELSIRALGILGFQCLILLICAIYLWKEIEN